ncbi:metal ABC transporter ATP-binding protein [Pigmentiphaga litoralis]|uniref:metal ABC transporter ATP-binding protein n=1 Tax=Pigmentiphaga litoralis TaxID=516702 RepID=UPI003B42C6B5
MLQLHDVSVGYGSHLALAPVSGAFQAGALTAIVGANGAGKSSLLKAMAGLVACATGHVDRGGLGPAQVAYLPQHAALDRTFPMSVGDLVGMGDWAHSGWAGAFFPRLRGRIDAALGAVGMAGMAGRSIAALSVGQFQRVLFARLCLQDAPVLLLDEPFAAVDEATTRILLDLMLAWGREGRTVIAVLHDLAMVRAHFSHTLVLAGGPVAWGATQEVLP